MIAVLAVLVAALLLLALAVAAAVDVFRQTAAWSARHSAGPQPWTATDDVQVARMLRHPAMPSGTRTGSALCSEQ
jgi:hypothetical protein